MPIRLVKQPLFFRRKGVQMSPAVGKPFDFTPDELKAIMALNAGAVAHIETAKVVTPATVIEMPTESPQATMVATEGHRAVDNTPAKPSVK